MRQRHNYNTKENQLGILTINAFCQKIQQTTFIYLFIYLFFILFKIYLQLTIKNHKIIKES